MSQGTGSSDHESAVASDGAILVDDTNRPTKREWKAPANVLAACFAAAAAIASAISAHRLYNLEAAYQATEMKATTVNILLQHRKRLQTIEGVHVCLLSYTKLPMHARKGVDRLEGSDKAFVCKGNWCDWYARCVGRSAMNDSEVQTIVLDRDAAWEMGTKIGGAVESYDTLGLMYAEEVVDRSLLLEFLKLELRWESPIVKYFRKVRNTIYSREILEEKRECLGRLIAEINGDNVSVPDEWKENC